MIEWFDDLKLGMRFKSGEGTVSAEDIKRFASEFDPQPFHLDEAAAQNTVSMGLRPRDGTPPPSRCVLPFRRGRSGRIR
jgi:acyl dehydratase